jgi:hypothetical protein
MSDALASLVTSRLPIVGLAAYSIDLPGRVLVTECFSKSLYPSSTEQMLVGLVRSGRTLFPAGESAAQYCWVFECLRVYVASRADGISLALMVENTSAVKTAKIQEMLQDFMQLAEV